MDLPVAAALLAISAPHFYAGVVEHDGRVVSAAPIVRYMRGWSDQDVIGYCIRKGWGYERIQLPGR